MECADEEAIAFMARTNKRRNLNSWQKAAIAAEAEELLAGIAQEAKERQMATLKQNTADAVTQTFVERAAGTRSEKETAHKAAEMFGTNRTYLNDAFQICNGFTRYYCQSGNDENHTRAA